MADETTTPLNQGLGKWLQAATGGAVETWNGTQKSSSIRGLSGVTMVDMWRLNTSFSGSADPIASNLERVDTNAFGQIGTGMTQASGVFTFPETGVYRVDFIANMRTDTTDERNTVQQINVTTDGGTSFTSAAVDIGHIKNIGGLATYTTIPSHIIIDVTDTSTHKVSFSVSIDAGTTTVGATDKNNTFMTFTRLGDT